MGCATALMAVAARDAGANSSGIVTYSGKAPAQTCGNCHSGGTAPLVRFEGPSQVDAGATATFTFVVTSQAPAQKYAGFDVAASAGQLGTIVNQGAQLLLGEVTHKASSKANAAGEASWNSPGRRRLPAAPSPSSAPATASTTTSSRAATPAP